MFDFNIAFAISWYIDSCLVDVNTDVFRPLQFYFNLMSVIIFSVFIFLVLVVYKTILYTKQINKLDWNVVVFGHKKSQTDACRERT